VHAGRGDTRDRPSISTQVGRGPTACDRSSHGPRVSGVHGRLRRVSGRRYVALAVRGSRSGVAFGSCRQPGVSSGVNVAPSVQRQRWLDEVRAQRGPPFAAVVAARRRGSYQTRRHLSATCQADSEPAGHSVFSVFVPRCDEVHRVDSSVVTPEERQRDSPCRQRQRQIAAGDSRDLAHPASPKNGPGRWSVFQPAPMSSATVRAILDAACPCDA
jgi:hypothetical protein